MIIVPMSKCHLQQAFVGGFVLNCRENELKANEVNKLFGADPNKALKVPFELFGSGKMSLAQFIYTDLTLGHFNICNYRKQDIFRLCKPVNKKMVQVFRAV